VIDLATNEEILNLGERGVAGSFNPEGTFAAGRFLAVAADGDVVEIYEVATRELLAHLERPALSDVEFDPTGRWLLISDFNGGVWVLDLDALVDGTPAEEAIVFEHADSGGVTRAALSAPGLLATSGRGSGLLQIWDVTTGELVVEFRTDRTGGPAVGSGWMAFSPGGSELFYVDNAGTIRRFPIDTDRLVELAQARLTRGFTAEECRRYLDETGCPPDDELSIEA
jgi:WD40 repeat protein